MLGGGGVHGGFQGGYLAEDGEKGGDSGKVACGGILGDCAGESDDGLAIFLGESGNADGGFASYGLTVETAFAGDNDVGRFP